MTAPAQLVRARADVGGGGRPHAHRALARALLAHDQQRFGAGDRLQQRIQVVVAAPGLADLRPVARVLRRVQKEPAVQTLGAGQHAAEHHATFERARAEHARVGGLGAGAGIHQARDGAEHVAGVLAQVTEEAGVGAGREQQQIGLFLRRPVAEQLDQALHEQRGGGNRRHDQALVAERIAGRVVVDHQRRQTRDALSGLARAVGGRAVQDDGGRVAGAVLRGHAGGEPRRERGDLRPGERAFAEGARLLAAAPQEAGERQRRGQAVAVGVLVAEEKVGVVR